ncbi:GNAT family N-acetyltransferase [Phaeovulum sp. W22_SRMD_FR3]|uniref:GNAT family N-acetyltransferase n=1 Tax=Phaeovulum sp. W22_SRMD_FR3 TaxID=3240274 RepID=UPI003F9DBB52
MRGIRIQHGLPPAQTPAAARLYWQAFAGKLGAVMGPEPLALRYIARVVQHDHAVVALTAEGVLCGVGGFRSAKGAFVGGEARDLRAVYGWWGGLWRQACLWLLNHDIEPQALVVDGLVVAPECRGQGIGAALLAALSDEARWRGHSELRLDVVAENLRARALYAREGFVIRGHLYPHHASGLVRRLYAYDAVVVMARPV